MGKKEQKKHNTRPYELEDDVELFNEMMEVASATECTGLMPSIAITNEQTKSYSQIYDVPLTEKRKLHSYDRDSSKK